RAHADAVRRAVFTDDAKRIATVSTDGTVKLWRIATRELVAFEENNVQVTGARFDPSGQRVLRLSNGDGRVWDLRRAGSVVTLPQQEMNGISDGFFTADGQRVVTASGSLLRAWR